MINTSKNHIVTESTSAGLQLCLLLKILKLSSFESISDTFVLEEEVLIIPNNKLSTKFTLESLQIIYLPYDVSH